MNMKERMLAVIRGEKPDRVPFVQYSSIAGPNEEIWKQIGQENMGLLQWCGVHRSEAPNCRFEHEELVRDGQPVWRNTLVTPEGKITEERIRVPSMGGVTAFAKHYIETTDDYRVLMSYLRDITVIKETNSVKQVISQMGDNGLPHISLERTPFQQLWIQWVSFADLSMHLVDEPELLDECMKLMGDVLLSASDVVLQAAEEVEIPYLVIGDNITAPLIGEQRFRKYCVPYYKAIADRLAEKQIPLFVHMDGDLKPIWDAIGESGVKGLDSLSPPPDNDTSVADAVSMWPDMRLLINFPSSVHLADAKTIYNEAREILEQGGHTGRLQIQISENMPPNAWQKSFPEIVRAIEDFGKP